MRTIINGRIYVDDDPASPISLAIYEKIAVDLSTHSNLRIFFRFSVDMKFYDAEADAFWSELRRAMLGEPPAAPPASAPAGHVVMKRPGLGDALVLMLAGRTGLDPFAFDPGNGSDIYLLGMSPARRWSLSAGGQTWDSTPDERGYAWAFLKGTGAVTVSVSSVSK